jgi:hypothetical protein
MSAGSLQGLGIETLSVLCAVINYSKHDDKIKVIKHVFVTDLVRRKILIQNGIQHTLYTYFLMHILYTYGKKIMIRVEAYVQCIQIKLTGLL